MKILVTGITGFVGAHLARDLVAVGEEVSGLCTDRRAEVRGASIHRADLRDPARLEELLTELRPDVVVHLAGLSHVGTSWGRPGDYLRVNFGGTYDLARILRRSNPGCRLLFASSAEVYGNVPEEEQPISEGRLLDPRSPYAMTKAAAEEVARDHGAVVVRSFNAIGPGQASTFALPSFAAQLAAIGRGEREPVLRVGDLSPRRDFLHVLDAVDAYRLLITEGSPGESYNIASGEALSIAEVLRKLMEISGVEAEVRREESRMRPVDIPLSRGENRKLRDLGWSPSRGVDAALAGIWREAQKAPSTKE